MRDADSTATPKRRARDLFRRAYRAQMRGELDLAVRLYTASIESYATAEAYTFLGWTHSFRKKYDLAMRCCEAAIRVDSEFGNPYNDIGAYLIELGRWNEAIPWFNAATRARRYASHHFPHFNLGRVYEHRFEWEKAEACYRVALRLEPRYTAARQALIRMQGLRN